MSQVTALDNAIGMCNGLGRVLLHASRFLTLPHTPSTRRTRICWILQVFLRPPNRVVHIVAKDHLNTPIDPSNIPLNIIKSSKFH